MRLTRAETRQRKRESLIDAAIAEIAAKGYAAARLDDIADRVDVTIGSIYSIFGSKQQLLVAVVDRLGTELISATADLEDPELSLDQVLRGIGTAWFSAATAPLARQAFAFEMELLSTVLRDQSINSVLGETFSARDHARLSQLLTDRAVTEDPTGPRTTTDQARHLALILTAWMTGLAQQAQLIPEALQEDDFVRSAAAAVTLLR
ncbi:TetR/AcrR family transcriptional regulator [Nocardia sp. XZ_19_385]|uniref:TetR/AcrR family transcriptional regulator n=1 Tax=Nocardia sp. XZ_19_385 TaxID=2769488 RepID=UPI0018900232|nr:TetR/AcrR family transcriptional regulator [Nocardia sp. XZ_19_385]